MKSLYFLLYYLVTDKLLGKLFGNGIPCCATAFHRGPTRESPLPFRIGALCDGQLCDGQLCDGSTTPVVALLTCLLPNKASCCSVPQLHSCNTPGSQCLHPFIFSSLISLPHQLKHGSLHFPCSHPTRMRSCISTNPRAPAAVCYIQPCQKRSMETLAQRNPLCNVLARPSVGRFRLPIRICLR